MDTKIAGKLSDFFTQYKQQMFKEGEILVRADENPSGIYYLRKGKVKVYIITKNGNDLVLNMFKPISFFPMNWAITGKANMYFYEAVTDVEVWKAPKDDVIQFVKDNPDVLYNLLARMYSGLDGLLTRVTYLMSANAFERLVAEIIIYAKRFYKAEIQAGKPIDISITEKELATLTGLTRETVSRELKSLKNKELITFARKVLTIPDIQKLESELTDLS